MAGSYLCVLSLLLLFVEASSLDERVEYKVNNETINTFVNTTPNRIFVPVATTNIEIVCYSDTQSNNWNVIINSFTDDKSGSSYECEFGDGRKVSVTLIARGHGVFYMSNGMYGTISTDESEDKQFVLEPRQDYQVVCSGQSPEWIDTYQNKVANCRNRGRVCQDDSVAGGNGLMFNEMDAPFEYVCRVTFHRGHHLHKIQFLSVDTVIPHNITISTVPVFPISSDGAITVTSLFVDIFCSCDAYPLSIPDYILIYNETITVSNTTNASAATSDHLSNYDVTCEVDNGISRRRSVTLVFDFSVGTPALSVGSVTHESAVLTWTPVTDYLEEYTRYRVVDSDGEVRETLTGGDYRYELDRLLSCVEQTVVVVAYIDGVEGEMSDSVIFTTQPQVITEAPSQLIDESVGTRHMLLTWPTVPTTSCTMYPISYTVLYQSTEPEIGTKIELVLESVPENQIGNGDMFVLLSELEEFYLYNVTVFASNLNGSGPVVTSLIRTLPTVPSSSALSLRLTQRTNLTWSPPAVSDRNGDIVNYTVSVRTVYPDRPVRPDNNFSANTSENYFVIQRGKEAVEIEISVTAVNQIGSGPVATLFISLNPYKEIPDIINDIGEEVSVKDSALLLNVSLIALKSETENDTTITPRQTSILVEALSKSLQGVLQAEEKDEVDPDYFQDLLTASSLLWERGIIQNEGKSVSPSKNFADFLGIVDFLSILFSNYSENENKSSILESSNLHLKLFPIGSGELFTTEFVEIQSRSPGMLSHVVIDDPSARGGDDDYLRFFKTLHNFNLISPNREFSAKILYNESYVGSLECVFFNVELGRWEATGVTTIVTRTGVECVTDHFSSFGVLVRPFETELTEEQNLALSVVSYILLSVSFILLSISILLYLLTARTTLRVEGNIIYFNYAIALFLATGSFLFGVQTATNSYAGCFIVTLLIHYSWLSVFAWSLCIGILLFYKIWFVFSEKRIWYYLILIGWGAPTIIVAITAGTANDYYIRTGEDHCWLSRENGVTWSFIAPILCVLVVNIFLLVVSTVRIYTSISRYEKGKSRALRVSLTSAVILIPVLNTPWLLLLFTLDRSTYSVIVEWIFIFINGSNGIIFFFLFVLRNNEISKAFKSSKLIQRILAFIQRGQKEGSVAKTSSRYSLKKQRTLESSVEPVSRRPRSKLSSDYQDTTSPRSSIGPDFPRPLTSPPQKTNSGFVSLPTHDEYIDDVTTEQTITTTTTTGEEPIYSKVVKKPKDPEGVAEPKVYVPLQDAENID